MPAPVAHEGRIVIVEDHVLFAESLLVVLEMQGHAAHRVLVTEQDVDAVVESVTALQPTLVVLDLDLGGGRDGVQVVPGLVRAGIQVLVVTSSTDRVRWGEALHRGAISVVSKTTSLPEVLRTVARIAAGQRVLADRERHELVQRYHEARAERGHLTRRFDRLSQRESQVLAQLVAGRQVRQIAEEGSVSEATVRTQVKSVLSKLGVGSQLAAVSMAHRVGWQGPDS